MKLCQSIFLMVFSFFFIKKYLEPKKLLEQLMDHLEHNLARNAYSISAFNAYQKMMATKSTMMVLSRVANDLRILNTDTMEILVKR